MNIFQKYKNVSAPVKASFWFIVSNVMLRGISFITLPIFSRLMSTSQYGLLSVYHSWLSIFTIFCTLTIWGGVFNVVMTKKSEEKDRYIAAFQGLATTITVMFLLFFVVFGDYVSSFFGISKFLLILIFINILSLTPFYLWSANQRFEYRYKALILLTVVTSILNPLIGYYAVINTDYKAEARILAEIAINILIGIFFFSLNIKKGHVFFNKEIWKYGFYFNVVLIPHYLSLQVLSQSDRLMINNFCGSSDAGIYSVAYSFAMLLTLITGGLDSSVTPYIYRNLKENTLETLKKNITFLILGIALVALCVTCVIPDFFRLMLPEAYYPAIWVIPPVIAAVFFMFLYPLFCSIEYYFEELKYASVSTFITAIVNIILNFVFIKIFGFIAAAYTTLFCYIALTIFHLVAMKVVLKKNNNGVGVYNLHAIGIISTIFTLCILGITILYINTFIRWTIVSVALIGVLILRKRIVLFFKSIKQPLD
ncbi:MAG: oligosaccharide flippase family protein [Treponema sp.]|nr:oligosaccharide flippase family protein [Treponema sp.]